MLRRFLAVGPERFSVAMDIRVLGLGLELAVGVVFAVRVMGFGVGLVFDGGPALTKLTASQTSPTPLASVGEVK